MEENHIIDAGDSHKYYSQIPHLIDDTQMSVHAFRLYVHIKRVVGKNGKCWQGTRTLAKKCNMSVGMVSQAKEELRSLKLIEIELVRDKKGEHHEITIVDIWPENMQKYSQSEQGCSCGEQGCSCDEGARSPGEPKKNPVKNNSNKNEEEGKSNIYQLYESSIGPMTNDIADKLKSLEDDYPVMWIEDALAVGKKNKARHINYVVRILEDWHINGRNNSKGDKKQKELSPLEKRLAKERGE